MANHKSGRLSGSLDKQQPMFRRSSVNTKKSKYSEDRKFMPPRPSKPPYYPIPAGYNEDSSSSHCFCGPDVYGKILGPTPDETILACFQTILDLYESFERCPFEDVEDTMEFEEYSMHEDLMDNCPNICNRNGVHDMAGRRMGQSEVYNRNNGPNCSYYNAKGRGEPHTSLSRRAMYL